MPNQMKPEFNNLRCIIMPLKITWTTKITITFNFPDNVIIGHTLSEALAVLNKFTIDVTEKRVLVRLIEYLVVTMKSVKWSISSRRRKTTLFLLVSQGLVKQH